MHILQKFFFGLLLIITLAISGCTAKEMEDSSITDENEISDVIEDTHDDEEITSVSEEEKVVTSAPASDETTKEPAISALLEEQLTFLSNFTDRFDGTSINTSKYSVFTKGPGAIKQDDKIITDGKGLNEIIWLALYTKKQVDFENSFTASVDVDLTVPEVPMGDAMAIIAVEPPDNLDDGLTKDMAYCELSVGGTHGGVILRADAFGDSKSIGTSTLPAKMTMTYDASSEIFTCKYRDASLSINQRTRPDKLILALRGGMHTAVVGGGERSTSGSFVAIFDNLEFRH